VRQSKATEQEKGNTTEKSQGKENHRGSGKHTLIGAHARRGKANLSGGGKDQVVQNPFKSDTCSGGNWVQNSALVINT